MYLNGILKPLSSPSDFGIGNDGQVCRSSRTFFNRKSDLSVRRSILILLIVFGAAALTIWLKGNPGSSTSSPPSIPTVDRIPNLKKQIAEQDAESAQAVAKYAPVTKHRIDDLRSPVVELLRSLPGVVQVEVGVVAKNPTSRIIHLRDWHLVPKELYALDMKNVYGRELTADEIDWLHQELLLEVELVQIEQMAVLCCLIRHHGLKKVFSEGFSPNELEAYREKIAVLKAMDQEQLPKVRKQLEEVRKLIEGSTGETKENTEAIETQLVTMLDDHKHRLLEMGAAGRLLISGELEDVLPLEDAEALEKATPISHSGEIQLDLGKIEARHDAQVKTAMKECTIAVIVLGGAHDLWASIRRASGNCEYFRVTTKRFREIAK